MTCTLTFVVFLDSNHSNSIISALVSGKKLGNKVARNHRITRATYYRHVALLVESDITLNRREDTT